MDGLRTIRRLALALAALLLPAAASAATLTWNGSVSPNWGDAANWTPSQVPATGDALILGNGASYPTNNNLVGVDLSSLTFGSSLVQYAVTGNPISLLSGGSILADSAPVISIIDVPVVLNGPATITTPGIAPVAIQTISGTGGLTLVATGEIAIAAPATYSGPTTITGTGPVTGPLPATSAVTVDGNYYFQGAVTIGSLSGSGTVTADGNDGLTVGGDGNSTTFSGPYNPVVPPFPPPPTPGLTKVGAGTMTLSGANLYEGPTTVSAGRLDVTGSIASPTIVASGATLGGTGTISSSVTVQAGGTLAPGVVAGVLTATGNVILAAGSTLAIQINGTTVGTQHDQVTTTGSVDLGSATLATTLGFTPALGDAFAIVNGAGGISGTFAGLPGLTTFISGSVQLQVDYTATSVIITVSGTLPGAPTIGTATAGNQQATISFTPPASTGGLPLTYTATCGAFSASGSSSPITVAGLTNGTMYSCSVTASNAVGTGPASGILSVTPFSAPSPVLFFSGPTATGTGTATVLMVGPNPTCGFGTAQFIPVTGHPASPPAGTAPAMFPHGLFDFTVTSCTPGSTVSMTIVYPSPLPAGTLYWKYGPEPGNPTPHWYVLPATIGANYAVISVTDGGQGDDDLTANGTIVDQGGPGGPPAGIGSIETPTMSQWMMMLMALLMMLGAWRWGPRPEPRLRRRGRQPG